MKFALPIATTCLGLAVCAPLGAAPDPPASIDLSDLPGALIDDIVVPVPREIFLSLDKLGDQDWAAQLKDSDFDKLGGRDQVALLFGVVVADGFVAVQAEDREAVIDIGRHVSRLAKALGVADAVSAHAAAIVDAAEADDWDGVRAELDRVQESVRAQMRAMRDEHLAELVSAGGWLRGTEAASALIAADYRREDAEILHQPDLAKHIAAQLAGAESSPLTEALAHGLGEITPLLSLKGGVPEYAVEKVHTVTAGLVRRIIDNAAK